MGDQLTHEDFPSVQIDVTAFDTEARKEPPYNGRGILTMLFSTANVTDGDRNEIGYIGGGAGSLVASFKGPDGVHHYYQIMYKEIFAALWAIHYPEEAGDGSETESLPG